MKKCKFSEEQIATAVRQADAGAPIPEVTRRLGISEATYYVWRKRYGKMAVAEVRRLRQLADENQKLKQLVADLTLDKVMLQEVLVKKGLTPMCTRPLATALTSRFAIGVRRACGLLRFNRASWNYRPDPPVTIVPFGNGLLNSPKQDRGLVSSGFTSCSGEKDGSLTRRACASHLSQRRADGAIAAAAKTGESPAGCPAAAKPAE